MTVELLYFDGCPNHESLLPRLQAILAEEGVPSGVELRRVESEHDARRLRFLGSPTVRVDGQDVEAGAEHRQDFGLKCRLYVSAGRLSGVPADGLIRDAIRAQALSRAARGCPVR
ncbi:MAG: DF family (seleno)protein [Solirubrobacteraceae bacterium]